MYGMNGTLAQHFTFESVENEKGQKSIDDGIYKIKSAKDTSKVLGAANGKKENSSIGIIT